MCYIYTNTLYSICYFGTVRWHMVTIFGMFPAYVSVVFCRTGSGSSMYKSIRVSLFVINVYLRVRCHPFPKISGIYRSSGMPTGRICAVVTEVPTYLMEKDARHIGVPRAEYRGPGTAGRVRAGESREGTHAHFVFQVYISPAPKPSKWRIGPQYEKCIWNLVYIDLTIYQVYIYTRTLD